MEPPSPLSSTERSRGDGGPIGILIAGHLKDIIDNLFYVMVIR